MLEPVELLTQGLRIATKFCHDAAVRSGWWSDKLGQRVMRNRAELIALMHAELSNALEAERSGEMDPDLPNRRRAEVELADAMIRIFDYAGAHGYDLAGAIVEKISFKAQKPDYYKRKS